MLPSTPKRRWFGALFRIKPTSYRLLSTQDAARTHATCKRVLEDMGVSVAAGQYASGSDALVLECVLADSRERDPDGVLTAVRGVRFRVFDLSNFGTRVAVVRFEEREPNPEHLN